MYQVPNAEECERRVAEALRVCYRLIDTAAHGNEAAVGKALKKSGVAREELFFTRQYILRLLGRMGQLSG